MDTHSMIILGNGFDVALGIPTRYSQFYDNSADLRKYADKGNTLCRHILSHINGDLWSDLEKGLYHYSLYITNKFGVGNREQAEIFEKEFGELKAALFNYLNYASGTPVAVIYEAPIVGLNIEWHKLQPQYLTFNYSINTANTASMNTRYILNGDDSIIEARFIYQHGSIYDTQACRNNSPDDIVVGIDPLVQKVETAHSFLYKIQQNLHDLKSTMAYINEKNLYVIYGCSIGDSDATYFRAFFNRDQKGKIFLIYGFGQDKIDNIKNNIERICEISINELSANNQVLFLDVKKVMETRQKTKEVIDNYIKWVYI